MKNKTAIITGGSRGIGKAAAIELSQKGVNVVINYTSNLTSAEDTAKICENFGVRAIIIKGDVSNMKDCEAMCQKAIDEFGSIDILVNNAGITKDNLIIRMSEQDFDDVIAVNLKGAFNMMKVASKIMMRQRSGKIINVSSVVGLMGNSGQVNYSASKAGVIGITKSLAKELSSRNITVNAVAPGFIDTDMTSVLSPETIDKIAQAIPLGKFGTPNDVAKAIAFLASTDAAYITGQVLSVDGGMCMN